MAEEPEPTNWADTPGASLAALFSNRFYVIANAVTTRIVFSEGVGGQTLNSHTAIVMPTGDAAELGRVLTETIAKNRAIAQQAPSAPPPADTSNA